MREARSSTEMSLPMLEIFAACCNAFAALSLSLAALSIVSSVVNCVVVRFDLAHQPVDLAVRCRDVTGSFCRIVFNPLNRTLQFTDIFFDCLGRIQIDEFVQHVVRLSQESNAYFLQKARHNFPPCKVSFCLYG